MTLKNKNPRGSVLVFTLLVFTILLSASLSAAGIVILGKNSSRATENSALAFQIADGASENILKRVYKDNDATVGALATSLYGSAGCTGGVVSGSLPSASTGATYEVAFLDNSDSPLQCSGAGYATYDEWRTKLVRIVATGYYAGATRAIDVTVEPPTCTASTVTDADGNVYDTVAIGSQCWMQQNMRVGNRINNSINQTNNGTIERYCFGNVSANCTTNHPNQPDGGLYTWDEAMQYSTTEGAQGICPNGWHIPTRMDLYTLYNHLDPTVNDPTFAATVQGTDVGFKIRPGGSSGFENNFAGMETGGSFGGRGLPGDTSAMASLLTSKEIDATGIWVDNVLSIDGFGGTVARQNLLKEQAMSVRCIKD